MPDTPEVPMTNKAKYLLITRSFPHCPQFFPQGFSTMASPCEYPLPDLHKKKRHPSTKSPLFCTL